MRPKQSCKRANRAGLSPSWDVGTHGTIISVTTVNIFPSVINVLSWVDKSRNNTVVCNMYINVVTLYVYIYPIFTISSNLYPTDIRFYKDPVLSGIQPLLQLL